MISARRLAHCPGMGTFVASFCGHIDAAEGIEYDIHVIAMRSGGVLYRQGIRTWRLIWTSLIVVSSEEDE